MQMIGHRGQEGAVIYKDTSYRQKLFFNLPQTSGSINEKRLTARVKAKIPPDKPPKEIDTSLSPRCAMQEMLADQRHS